MKRWERIETRAKDIILSRIHRKWDCFDADLTTQQRSIDDARNELLLFLCCDEVISVMKCDEV